MRPSAKIILREFTENKELMSEDKVVVKPAGHKGNGLFAKVDIKKGETFLKSKVTIISDEEWEKIQNTEPVKLYFFNWDAQHGIPLGKWKFDFKNANDKKAWSQTKFFKDGALKISGFLYINDIDEKTKANCEEIFDIPNKIIGMKATRDIKAGEEFIKEYNEGMRGNWRKKLKEGLNLEKKQWEEIEIPCGAGEKCIIKVNRNDQTLLIDNVGLFKIEFGVVEYDDAELEDDKSASVFFDGEKTDETGMLYNGIWSFGNWDYSITRESKDPYVAIAKLVYTIY
jgi:hypothetical protein